MSMQVMTRPSGMPVAPVSRMLLASLKARAQFYRHSPLFLMFSMVLPLMFYAIFGTVFAPKSGAADFFAYLLGSYGAYAVSSIMVFNIGIGVATARAQKIDVLQRATPLPGWVAIASEIFTAMAVAVVSLIPLFIFGAAYGHVQLSAARWLLLLVSLVFGALPVLGLGLAIGYGASANNAPALANLIYLPMSVLSGLFIPLTIMPDWIQRIGVLFPTYHYGQLAWNSVGQGKEDPLWAILWLIVWAAVLFGIAARFYRRDQTRKFA